MTLRMTSRALEAASGQHEFDVGNCLFTVDKRYTFNKVIGRGAYGTVVSCHDAGTGKEVAIKKVAKAFEDVTDSKRLLREIMLLRHLEHENTIGLLDIVQPNAPIGQFQDVYMVLELMETDLHRIIHSKQPLTDEHVQFFIAQVLKALRYMHSAGVVHRDLKPSNLLVNSSCDLKICDFGLARGLAEEEVALTEYVVTRWYRAPEVMLSSKNYTYSVDVWSTGCILAELLLRRPLFQGDDYIHQLQLINDLLGSPSEKDLHFVASEKARKFMQSLPTSRGISFEAYFVGASPGALDLLRRMLTFDPAKRITVDEALNHPYLAEFAGTESTPICPTPFDFKFEQQPLDVGKLRELVWKEICHFRPAAQKDWQAYVAQQTSQTVQTSNLEDHAPAVSALSEAGSVRQDDAAEELRKRRRPEDTITPMKAFRHDPNMFVLGTPDEKVDDA